MAMRLPSLTIVLPAQCHSNFLHLSDHRTTPPRSSCSNSACLGGGIPFFSFLHLLELPETTGERIAFFTWGRNASEVRFCELSARQSHLVDQSNFHLGTEIVLKEFFEALPSFVNMAKLSLGGLHFLDGQIREISRVSSVRQLSLRSCCITCEDPLPQLTVETVELEGDIEVSLASDNSRIHPLALIDPSSLRTLRVLPSFSGTLAFSPNHIKTLHIPYRIITHPSSLPPSKNSHLHHSSLISGRSSRLSPVFLSSGSIHCRRSLWQRVGGM
ncbi:hypothetical protein JAAARDRAFT_333016 [Jaapia argillacea MUCL 33604]|uniref:F-box domain-containing protein n=1 Tax=Jaapia argillacea MUCL 33604 TaxID=933084 RepID=A0A067PKE7_9AGAM|nr:hypothetical protein JAAARDRAFT_333016 [Jaapia argillacea MUCL 33604]